MRNNKPRLSPGLTLWSVSSITASWKPPCGSCLLQPSPIPAQRGHWLPAAHDGQGPTTADDWQYRRPRLFLLGRLFPLLQVRQGGPCQPSRCTCTRTWPLTAWRPSGRLWPGTWSSALLRRTYAAAPHCLKRTGSQLQALEVSLKESHCPHWRIAMQQSAQRAGCTCESGAEAYGPPPGAAVQQAIDVTWQPASPRRQMHARAESN